MGAQSVFNKKCVCFKGCSELVELQSSFVPQLSARRWILQILYVALFLLPRDNRKQKFMRSWKLFSRLIVMLQNLGKRDTVENWRHDSSWRTEESALHWVCQHAVHPWCNQSFFPGFSKYSLLFVFRVELPSKKTFSKKLYESLRPSYHQPAFQHFAQNCEG